MEIIYSWTKHVNVHFNSDKFECMRFWPNSSMPEFDYEGPDGDVIEVKDLGVHFSSDLTFKIQIAKIVTCASKLTGWVLEHIRGETSQQ